MSRILFGWELGLNFGHLARLLPLAQRLKSDNHLVVVASREILPAARILTPAGIPYVQAPLLLKGLPLNHRPASYADLVLSQGWKDQVLLGGLISAWLNLFRLFRPDRVVLDYSPTASLAARIAKIPTVLVGNGFELPPATNPLPPFPGFSWATEARAVESEKLAVGNANGVLARQRAAPLQGLCDLVTDQTRLLATFPELDHYGERSDVPYIGPLLGEPKAPRVDWPQGSGPRVFACVRPDTSHVEAILAALGSLEARVICVASGFTPKQLAPFSKLHICFCTGLVDLQWLADADLCLTYGAEGTMLRFLLMGVPQLISPWHVETYMAARRVAAAGLGAWLDGVHTAQSIVEVIEIMLSDNGLRERVRRFAQRSRPVELGKVAALTLGEEKRFVEACA